MSKINEAPVLLIIFNRPDTLKVVFDVIQKSKPAKLYVSADGPRKGNENDKINCEKAREIVKKVDWECEVKYRFLDENLGCGWGPASAISWAFENEDRLIIIEDDCVPSQSLFDFHNYLLEKYKNDTRVWIIGGQSIQQNTKFFENSDYIFSHYGSSMGWATWKRCWNYFDIEMKGVDEFLKIGGAENVCFSKQESRFFNQKYQKLSLDKTLKTHAWDIQFSFSILSNGGLSIIPAKNLAEHIGFIGTHDHGKTPADRIKLNDNFSIKQEPIFVLANREYDLYHFKHYIVKILGKSPLYKRIIRKGLKIIGLR